MLVSDDVTLSAVAASLNWLAIASVVALLLACLWDKVTGYALRGLYGAGLIAAGMALLSFNYRSSAWMVSLVVIFSLYTLATGVLWRKRGALARFVSQFGIQISEDDSSRFSSWLTVVNLLLGVAAYIFTFGIVLSFESLRQRLISSTISFLIPISIALLVRVSGNQRLTGVGNGIQSRKQEFFEGAVDSMNTPVEGAGIAEGKVGNNDFAIESHLSWDRILIGICVWMSFMTFSLWGWSWLTPDMDQPVINRAVIVMIIAEAILVGYRFIISSKMPIENEWRRGLKSQLLIIACIGFAALVATLSVEAMNYTRFDIAMMSWPVVAAVFVVLISLFCACIEFALNSGRDPFKLSDRGRMSYVYCAEALTVITLLHARVTMPWLFGDFFRTWWPLVLMALAFTGVGLGELFRKRGNQVFAEPLERTGILLPLLPVIGYWLIGFDLSYSGLLFLVGLFYGILSVARRSITFGILAVFAGNGGMWNLLKETKDYGFYQHPQLWLIPLSLSVLAAARINRERLTQDQMTTVRYATLIMIYVSSTSDIFINGASDSAWLTLILAVLSVMGVIAGLMMRVRAFLFLGAAFLLLSVVTMIWTASVNLHWVWLWYVTGIAFGVLIFLTAVLFEKKRQEMLELLGRLKQWQA